MLEPNDSALLRTKVYDSLVHLFQEHLLSGFLEAETEVQGRLFHGSYFLKQGLHQAHKSRSFAEFP